MRFDCKFNLINFSYTFSVLLLFILILFNKLPCNLVVRVSYLWLLINCSCNFSIFSVCNTATEAMYLYEEIFSYLNYVLSETLQVSSIRESKSDDKRFSIFTGTKRLHLRAETHEDRVAWMEALQAVKDMFPRMSNSELMAPINDVTVSTEKLRQRLLEEGVSEAAIQDSDQIMRSEFSALQNQLVLLKQKQWLLIDMLRHLEVHVMNYFFCLAYYCCMKFCAS